MTVDLGVLPIGKIFKYLSYVDRHNSRMVILRGKIVPIEQYYNNNLDYTVRVSGSMTTIYLNTKHQLEKTERIDDWPVYVCNNELVVR